MFSSRKNVIIIGLTLLFIVVIWSVVSIIDSSALRISRVYDVKRDFPFLVVCFDKEIKSNSLKLTSQDFIIKNRDHPTTKCESFLLSVKESSFTSGDYTAVLYAESKSGKVIDNESISFKIVDSDTNNTLPTSDIGKMVIINNDVSMEEWMNYWSKEPIYKHVDVNSLTYKGAMWSISLRADNEDNPIVIIYINMPQPPQDRPVLVKSAEQYKKAALEEIKSWNVDIDNYTIEYRFNG
jgi:hypothetical protein